MGQQLARKRKNKWRPSKRNPLRRRRDAADDTAATGVRRRSLRRRRCLSYYDDCRDDDDDDYDDDDDEIIREKKLNLVLDLATSRKVRKITPGAGFFTSATASVVHAPPSSPSSSSSTSENVPPKRRRINGGCGLLCRNSSHQEEVDGEEEECSSRYESGGELLTGGNQDAAAAASHSSSDLPLPHNKSLELILDKLQKKDVCGVYAEPVDPEELPDYHDRIEHPIDFATVRNKLENGSYSVLKEFESDVYLICSNAMRYNTSDTIYYKQARAIQELARKKFERVKIDIRFYEKEKASQKVILDSSVNKKMCKPACMAFQEPVGSDFSSGATLATAGETQNAFNTCHTSFDRHNRVNMTMEGNSSRIDSNYEKAYELISGRGLPQSKFGRKSEAVEDNPRATYNISDGSTEETVFSTFEAEPKRLVAVGLHAEHSYARSLSLFSATLGPDTWRASADRIRQVLPPGFKFGRGWVGEYELPLPPPPPLTTAAKNASDNGRIPSTVDGEPPSQHAQRLLFNRLEKQQQFTNGMATPGHDQSTAYDEQNPRPNGMATPVRGHSTERSKPWPPKAMATPGHDPQTGFSKPKPQPNGMVTAGRNCSTGYGKQQPPDAMVTPGHDRSEQHPPNGIVTPGNDRTTRYGRPQRPNAMLIPGHDQSAGYKQHPAGGMATPGHDDPTEYNRRQRFLSWAATLGSTQYSWQQKFSNGMMTPGHDVSANRLPNRMATPGDDRPPNGNITPVNNNKRIEHSDPSPDGMATRGHDRSTEYSERHPPNATMTAVNNNKWTEHGQPSPGGMAACGHDRSTEYIQQRLSNGMMTPGNGRGQNPPNGMMTSGPEVFDRPCSTERGRISAHSLYNRARSGAVERSTEASSPPRAAISQQTAEVNSWRCRRPAEAGIWQKLGPDLNIGYQWLGPPSAVLLDPQQPDLALQL